MPTLPRATDPAPGDWAYGSALWLLARHPRLVRWVQRIPGAWDVDEDAETPYNPVPLRDAITAADDDYDDDTPAHGGAEAFAVMSSGERASLRLLAFLDGPVLLSLDVVRGFDPAGERLVRDWQTATLAHHGIPPA